MHKVISAHLKKFVTEQSFEQLEVSKQFERFSNFCIVYKFYSIRFDVNNVTSEDDDCGIDGIALIVDGELVTTIEEVKQIFKRTKKNMSVQVIFIQSKTSEKFDRGEILKFSDGVLDFLSDSPNLPQGDFIHQSKELFDLVIENAPKIVHGKPDCYLYYVTTGKYGKERELEATFVNTRNRITDSGFFNNVSVIPIEKDELIKLWLFTYSGVEAKIEVKGYTPYPEMSGIAEAYIVIVPAKNFVSNVLSDEDGKLRNFIFHENVRAFLGQENSVNKMIQNTLISEKIQQERFGIMNNGITIISPNVKVQSDSIYMENFQIVNGCQTSNVLYENRDSLSENTMLALKVVEATNPDVISDIIRATNNQTKVEEIQFLSLQPIIRKVEEYFEAVSVDSDDEIKLYFERRESQYVGLEIAKNRIFDIKEASIAAASMFLERPELAVRYPTQMVEELNEELFNDSNKEVIFYTASLALYRIKLLIGNKKISSDFSKYKWHMLMCLKYIITGEKGPNLTSTKMEKFCQKIINICKNMNDKNLDKFKKVENLIKHTGDVSRDRLKGKPYTEELKKLIHSQRSK
ncbi:MAG: AIPR family protein [Lyngbya sp.]|nr:AIPR family protein [Lyngbya sp.]